MRCRDHAQGRRGGRPRDRPEALRAGDEAKWGQTPFTIGLWVGQKSTPNTTEESHDAVKAERD
ncbi:hypothetical protein CTI14_55600, partial [Methylobacterium radiotolerans]